jgi:hypothetical protein
MRTFIGLKHTAFIVFFVIFIVNLQSQKLNNGVKLSELKIIDKTFLTSIINPVSKHLMQSKRYSKTYVCEFIFDEKDKQSYLRVVAFRSVDDIIRNNTKRLYGFFVQNGHVFIIRNNSHYSLVSHIFRDAYNDRQFAIKNYPIVIEENPIWIFVYLENKYILSLASLKNS